MRLHRLILMSVVLIPLVGLLAANDSGRSKTPSRRDTLEQVTVRCRHVTADKMSAILSEVLSIAGEDRVRNRVSTIVDTESNTVTMAFPREHRESLTKLVELIDTPATRFQIDAKLTMTDANGKEEQLSAPRIVIADGQAGFLEIATPGGVLAMEVRPVVQAAAAPTTRTE